jgi:hypothetical protein
MQAGWICRPKRVIRNLDETCKRASQARRQVIERNFAGGIRDLLKAPEADCVNRLKMVLVHAAFLIGRRPGRA